MSLHATFWKWHGLQYFFIEILFGKQDNVRNRSRLNALSAKAFDLSAPRRLRFLNKIKKSLELAVDMKRVFLTLPEDIFNSDIWAFQSDNQLDLFSVDFVGWIEHWAWRGPHDRLQTDMRSTAFGNSFLFPSTERQHLLLNYSGWLKPGALNWDLPRSFIPIKGPVDSYKQRKRQLLWKAQGRTHNVIVSFVLAPSSMNPSLKWPAPFYTAVSVDGSRCSCKTLMPRPLHSGKCTSN